MLLKKILRSFKPKPQRLLGIDLNSHAIRLVELSFSQGNYQVETWANITLPLIEMNGTKLSTIIQQSKTTTKIAAIALSHSEIIFKEIKVISGLSPKKLNTFLQFNMEKYIGTTADSVSFDYHLVQQVTTKEKHILLQLAAARRERIVQYLQLLQAANLSPKIIDVNSCALERIVRHQLKNIIGLVAIINIEIDSILIVVINHEKTIYTHEDCITATMQTTAQITEQLILKLQLVFAAVTQPLNEIILAGAKATAAGLDITVSEQLKIPTTVLNPYLNMRWSTNITKTSDAAMTISCGLALRVTDAI